MKMKTIKSVAIMALSVFMTAGLSSCTSKTSSEPAKNVENSQNSTEQSEAIPENIQSMFDPADSLLMCMVETNSTYNPKDPEFFWSAIYDFAALYGSKHSLSKLTDTALVMPRQAVQEYATVLFSDYDDLLDLPQSLSDRIKYDADTDSYSFGLGDRGLSKSVITGYSDNGDGSYMLNIDLVGLDDNKVISSGKFTLVPNEYASSISDPIYTYSISGADASK